MTAVAWAAIATAASAVFIAYQAIETRKLARETALSLQTANAIEIESAKSRLDAQGPGVSIICEGATPDIYVALDQPTARDNYGTPPRYCRQTEPDEELDTSSTSCPDIILQAIFTARNDGRRTVRVTLGKPLARNADIPFGFRSEVDAVYDMQPGANFRFLFAARLPTSEWATNASLRHEVNPIYHVKETAIIEADDGFDNGVRDTWEVTLSGVPVSTKSPDDPVVVVNNAAPGERLVRAEVGTAYRRYFVSKRTSEELDQRSRISAEGSSLPWWTRAYRKAVRGNGLQREGNA